MKKVICLAVVALSIGCSNKSEELRSCLHEAKKVETSCAETCNAQAIADDVFPLASCEKECRDYYYMACR
jgi:hypothetical protein